jgi:hypothetical protein
MHKLLSVALFVGACGGSDLTSVTPSPRPQPAQGGFQAQQQPAEGWRNLGQPVEVSQIQRTLQLSGQGGKIATLMIKGVSGEPEIEQVLIEYMDQAQKKVDVNRRFVPGDGQVLELQDDRPINKIIVIMDPDSQGTFEIFGA